MNAAAGTATLVRLALRRDLVMLPVWILALAATAGSSAAATVGLFPSEQERIAVAETSNHSQALVALYGRIYDPSSLGSIALVKLGGTGAVFVAVFAALLMIRHTRAEEETGRLELVGAAAVGRRAPLTAAFLVALAAHLALALLTALALIGAGLPAAGSFAFGLSWASVGLSFSAIAAVAAQLTTAARAATALTMSALGAAYLLRAAGDLAHGTGLAWLTWLSPIGWSQQLRPYAGDRWWVLLVVLAFTALMAYAAYLLTTRRDLGAGVLPDRPGPASAAPSLRSPLALAWRLQRPTFFVWAAGFALLGLVVGAVAHNAADFLQGSQAQAMITALGGRQTLIDAFLATELTFMAVIASAYGVQATLRLHAEEAAHRVDPLLSTATGRTRWALSHYTVALGGTAALIALAGACTALPHALRTGDPAQFPRVLGSALAHLPAAWTVTALALLLYALAPRLAALAWAALAAAFLLLELGALLELPQPVMDLSPYVHTPKFPGAPFTLTPLLALTAVAALLSALGLAVFRRRDIG